MAFVHENWIVDVGVFLITVIVCLYIYFTRNFNHWKSKGVPYVKPVPFLGNFYECATMKKTIGDFLADLYKKMENIPFFGIFILDKPFLVVTSPELIKAILVKDFNYFSDRTALSNVVHDPLTAHMLFFSKNPDWKTIRSKLTPTFTSGKMKAMFPLINEVAEDLQSYVSKHAENSIGWLEAKEICAKYSTDVITSCAFGINGQSFEKEDADFRSIGRDMFRFTSRNGFVQSSYFFAPAIAKALKFTFFPENCNNFLRNALWKTIDTREKSNIKRNDLVDILIKLRQQNDSLKESAFDNDKLVAQAAQFFGAGFETTSSTIAFTLYELALNETIQNQLREEIIEKIEEHGGLTYEAMQSMTYLHKCILETLRKYPVLPFLDRTCMENYKLPGTDVTIEKGTPVYIPMFGLHYDPKYFPKPELYNPERFSEENVNKRHPFCYLPFGEGPRICIGERFGLLGSKLALIKLLTEFKLERCEKTPVPIVFEEKTFIVASKYGLPLTFKKLQQN